MGPGGIGIWQLLIILVLVILIFGTKKLKNVGGDLGGAIKSFKKSMKDDGGSNTEASAEPAQLKQAEENVVEGKKVEEKEKA